MKKLYLVRHAKSSWEDNDLKDIERPLNKRGEKDAPFIAQLMHQKKIKPGIMVSSPAERALSTAKVFCREMNIPEKDLSIDSNLYEADRKEILKAIHKLDNVNDSAMVFSHNPGLTELAGFLTKGIVYDIPTCGIVSLICSIDEWEELNDTNCELNFFEYPKKHSK